MNNLAIQSAFGAGDGRKNHAFKRVMTRTERRVGSMRETRRLSLSSAGYLYDREGVADRQQASEATEERSLRVAQGQLVVNPMWLTGGSIAVSDVEGAVSPDYRVFEPDPSHIHPRYLHHLVRSQPYRDQYNCSFEPTQRLTAVSSKKTWINSLSGYHPLLCRGGSRTSSTTASSNDQNVWMVFGRVT